MLKLLSRLAGLMALAVSLFGTWVKPIVEPSKVEKLKDAITEGWSETIADKIKDFSLD